ncbi:hypothetical protein CPB85DRAFT_1304483 [Mucidula mucida]|nr:hypothetical protein CPB85DRAFT_1304483 [Mucidula mucida]
MDSKPTLPSDMEVLLALDELPTPLGRPKILAALKTNNNWALSDTRLKKLIEHRNEAKNSKPPKRPLRVRSDPIQALTDFMNAIQSVSPADVMKVYKEHPELHCHRPVRIANVPDHIRALPPPSLPDDPLAAQLRYFKESTRIFVLYGRGHFDYGVTTNSSDGLMLQICRDEITRFLENRPRPLDANAQYFLNRKNKLHTLFEYYEAAGRKASLPAEDVARQFEAEWGINPLRFRTEEENDPQYRAFYNDWKEEIHKAASIPLYTSTFYAAPHLTTFKVEQDGMVAYDVKTFGRFAIIIVKIDKQTGKECGEL